MIQAFTQLAELLSPFRKQFYRYLGIVVIYEAVQIANSYVLTGAIRLYQNFNTQGVWIAFGIGLLVCDQIFRLLDHWLDWKIVSELLYPINKHIKMMVVTIFLKQDAAWHQQNNSGVLIGKAENGIQKVAEMTDMLAWEFIPTSIQSLLTMPALFYFSPKFGAIILISLVSFMGITKHAEWFRLPLRKKRHDMYEALWQSTEEAVKAHETLAIYGQTNRVLEHQNALNNQVIQVGIQEAKTTIFRYHEQRAAVNQTTSRLILFVMIWQLNSKTMTLPELFFVATLTERLLAAFWRFARMTQRVGECSEGINRLYHLSHQTPAITDGPETRYDIVVPEQLSVEFRNVTFYYPNNNKPAVKNVTLHIEAGQEVGIVGPSGSGKTTLRRLLLRLYEISEGDILIAGIPIKQWPLEQLRSLFAYVPQGDEVFIFDSTVLENIRLARPEASNEEIFEAAKQAGIGSFINTLSEGYDTQVGEKGMKLSGGQKQRIALARAILSKRKFLILDEATSSVDMITEQEIQHELKEVMKGVTAIVIAHRMNTIWGADKIVVMKNGGIESVGTHVQLMKTPGLYSEMVVVQMKHTCA